MTRYSDLICPVSAEKVDENRVRITALLVVLTTIGFLYSANPLLGLALALDFFIRAFTPLKSSPMSWLAGLAVRAFRLQPVMINKGPKIFAARVGFIFSVLILGLSLISMITVAQVIAATLVLFAFMECALNFCTGCWVYSRLVLPLVRK